MVWRVNLLAGRGFDSEEVRVRAAGWLAVVVATFAGCGSPPVPTPTNPGAPGPTVPTGPPPVPCSVIQVAEGDWRASEALDFCLSFNAVGGDLTVDDQLDELTCLCEVQGSLRFTTALGRATLANLNRIGGDLKVEHQSGLTQVDLPALATVDGSVLINNATTLEALEVPALHSVAAVFVTGSDLGALSLPALTAVGSIIVQDNDILKELSFGAVDGADELLIENNAELESIGGLEVLATVADDLRVVGNADLTEVTGFGALETVGGSLVILDDGNLSYIGGFSALVSVGGDLTLEALPDLSYVEAFAALQTVGGALTIQDAEVLLRLDAFGALESAGSTTFHGLSLLEELPAAPSLTTLSALTITELGRLFTLPEWSALATVGGDLVVSQNPLLQRLDDLGAVQVIGGDLVLDANPSLSDVTAFYSVQQVGGDLIVRNNVSLGSAQASALATAIDEVGGTTTLMNNGP
jgi:hypothetical protein